jgi:hypothetical protein
MLMQRSRWPLPEKKSHLAADGKQKFLAWAGTPDFLYSTFRVCARYRARDGQNLLSRRPR